MSKKDQKIAKGVHDPWRMGTPEWEAPPTSKNAGMKKSKHPFDWDLQPDKRYVFRMDDATGALVVTGTDEAERAAELVMIAIREIPDVALELEKSGFNHGPVGDVPVRGFFFSAKEYVVTHPAATRGTFTQFIRAFLRVNRTSGGRKQLNKMGIKPILAG